MGSGYEVAAFSWTGIRQDCSENSQVDGMIIKKNAREFLTFTNQFVINEPEGIRCSRNTEVSVNFDKVEYSICNFEKKLEE